MPSLGQELFDFEEEEEYWERRRKRRAVREDRVFIFSAQDNKRVTVLVLLYGIGSFNNKTKTDTFLFSEWNNVQLEFYGFTKAGTFYSAATCFNVFVSLKSSQEHLK